MPPAVFAGPIGAAACRCRTRNVRECSPGGRLTRRGNSAPGAEASSVGLEVIRGISGVKRARRSGFRLRSRADAVASAALRFVELVVGALDQVGGGFLL